MKDLNQVSLDMEDTVSDLLEFAANNDVFAFKRSVELNLSAVDKAGFWYVRKKGSKQITQEERTPLMIAATYGSVDVLKLLVALPEVDLNKSCGQAKWTALHCAAFGGSINAFEAIRLLLSAGADPKIEDVSGWCPVDVLVRPILPGAKAAIYDLLVGNISDESIGGYNLRVSMCGSNLSSPRLSSSPEIGMLHSASNFVSSPRHPTFGDTAVTFVSDKKQYPVDSSFPDIRDGIFLTDEFRMYSFKIKPCSRAYSHDWTECPFAHPGENARRRDPRKYHYSCVPCPDFRKGACKRADMCEYAHGVFECWLHPAQYRTRMCKDGTNCARQVCFFAHTEEELRPLYASTGSGVPSPRSAASSATFMDMAAALNHLCGSPTSQSLMSPMFNQAMSPTKNGMSQSTTAWPQPNVPTLNLPGTNLKSSRLRSSFSARDVPLEDVLQDFDIRQPDFSNLVHFSQPRPNSAMLSCSSRSKTILTPSNLKELFSTEICSSSPRFSDQAAAFGAFSPSHKAAVLNQYQQLPGILSPNSANIFSPKNVEHPLSHSAFDASSYPQMSQGSFEPGSPMNAHLSAFVQRERQQQLCSVSAYDLGSNNSPIFGSPATVAWSKWGSPSPNRKADWSITRDDQACLKRSCSLDVKSKAEEPNLAWKEPSSGIMDKRAAFISAAAAAADVPSGEFLKPDSQIDPNDHSVLGAWLEQMRLDQLAV